MVRKNYDNYVIRYVIFFANFYFIIWKKNWPSLDSPMFYCDSSLDNINFLPTYV